MGGVALAAAAWAWLFRGRVGDLWGRSLVAGPAIGAYGLVAQRHRLGPLFGATPGDVVIGLAAAPVLYGIFWVGERVLRTLVPRFEAQVGELYGRAGAGAKRRAVVVVAIVVVASCEEVFWRGFVQPRTSLVVALAAYTAVHLVARNWAIVLAAAAAGAAWAGLFAWRGTLVAAILCHVLWDLTLVVWFPLGRE